MEMPTVLEVLLCVRDCANHFEPDVLLVQRLAKRAIQRLHRMSFISIKTAEHAGLSNFWDVKETKIGFQQRLNAWIRAQIKSSILNQIFASNNQLKGHAVVILYATITTISVRVVYPLSTVVVEAMTTTSKHQNLARTPVTIQETAETRETKHPPNQNLLLLPHLASGLYLSSAIMNLLSVNALLDFEGITSTKLLGLVKNFTGLAVAEI